MCRFEQAGLSFDVSGSGESSYEIASSTLLQTLVPDFFAIELAFSKHSAQKSKHFGS